MSTGRVCVIVGENGEPIPVPPPSPIEMDIVMPDGWTLNDDGSATKDEDRAANGRVAVAATLEVPNPITERVQ